MNASTSNLPLASRRRRFAATLIDMLLVPGLTIFLVMVAGVVEDAEDYADYWWVLWVLLLAVASYLLLNGYFLWRSGQTIGKKLFGIAIVNNSAGGGFTPAPWWKLICIRALFFPLLFLTVVPPLTLLPLLDQGFGLAKKRRCLHDYASGTRVIKLG